MIHVVKIAPTAERQLHKFDPQIRRRVQAAIDLLAENPRPPRATQLVGGAGEWRVRTGEYRIVYDIRDGLVTVLVLKVGHRRDVYEAR
jgi:mRNA interferase RelE/StbE